MHDHPKQREAAPAWHTDHLKALADKVHEDLGKYHEAVQLWDEGRGSPTGPDVAIGNLVWHTESLVKWVRTLA